MGPGPAACWDMALLPVSAFLTHLVVGCWDRSLSAPAFLAHLSASELVGCWDKYLLVPSLLAQSDWTQEAQLKQNDKGIECLICSLQRPIVCPPLRVEP